MNLSRFFLYFLLVTSCQIFSQINTILKDSIVVKNNFEKFVGADIHENLFFQQGVEVHKINNKGSWVYANFELGVPDTISVLNPLEILLFYKAANIIVLLDRFLNEVRRIDFNTLEPPKIAWDVGNTKNHEIWILNGETNRLEFFNFKRNTILSQSIPFLNEPYYIASGFSEAFVFFKDKICEYNIYGTEIGCIEQSNITSFSYSKGNLLLKNEKEVYLLFDDKLQLKGELKISKNKNKDFSLSAKKLYIYSKNTVKVYQLIFPSK